MEKGEPGRRQRQDGGWELRGGGSTGWSEGEARGDRGAWKRGVGDDGSYPGRKGATYKALTTACGPTGTGRRRFLRAAASLSRCRLPAPLPPSLLPPPVPAAAASPPRCLILSLAPHPPTVVSPPCSAALGEIVAGGGGVEGAAAATAARCRGVGGGERERRGCATATGCGHRCAQEAEREGGGCCIGTHRWGEGERAKRRHLEQGRHRRRAVGRWVVA